MDLVMTVEFEMEKKRDPFYEVFLTASNRNSYRLVRYFYPYYQKLKKYIKFQPRYSLWQCQTCKWNEFKSDTPSQCVSRGRYCAYSNGINDQIDGRDIVMEDLRQICIFNINTDQWFNYLDQFD